ncbi:MAG TPA: hypothetical protein VHG28_16805 [Longimicrobiaceae bacterium]|nr:hypothetical protein [Longimicrobiaceae bacterium]
MLKPRLLSVLLLASLAGAAACSSGDSTYGASDDNVDRANANPEEARNQAGPDSANVDLSPGGRPPASPNNPPQPQ